MKYAEFKTTVADWLNKSNLNGMIPALIRYGQEMLEADLKLDSMIVVQNIDLASGAESFLEPDRFLEMVTARLISDSDSHIKYDPLQKKEWKFFVDNLYPEVSAGLPLYYSRANIVETTDASLPDTGITALSARSFVFEKPTDADYILEYQFYRKEAEFTTASSTNWWLANAEEALLHAVLVKASVYLANDDPRIDVWLAGYELAKGQLETNDRRARRGGSAPNRNKAH